MFDVQSKSKVLFMSALAEANHLVKALGGNADTKKGRRLNAWRKVAANFTWNRIVDLDRAATHARVSGDELRILRAAARQQEEAEREGRDEYREIVERLARLEARLLTIDQDFFGEEVAALRGGARMARRVDSSLDTE